MSRWQWVSIKLVMRVII